MTIGGASNGAAQSASVRTFRLTPLASSTDQQHIGYYASVNLLYYPMQNVTLGIEGLWGERVDINGAKGQDERVQFSARVKF